jgi:hypothetical protein
MTMDYSHEITLNHTIKVSLTIAHEFIADNIVYVAMYGYYDSVYIPSYTNIYLGVKGPFCRRRPRAPKNIEPALRVYISVEGSS